MNFNIISVGIAEYANNPDWTVTEAASSRERVEDLFLKHGATAEDWTHLATTGRIRSVLGEWTSRVGESHILYWTGHGEYSDYGYLAALADSPDPLNALQSLTDSDLHSAVLQWANLRDAIGMESWLLIVLDTCGSASGAWMIDRAFAVPPSNVVIVGGSDGAEFSGRLAADLDVVLEGFTGNDAHIQLRELIRRLADLLDHDGIRHIHGSFAPSLYIANREDTPPPAQAPVDVYREIRKLFEEADPHVRNHFFAKAQGAEIGELTWHFVGREEERADIAAWLKLAESGMYVVSGLAGSGKSALMGMVLATSDESFVQALTLAGYPPIEERLCASGVHFDAVLYLTGRTLSEVTDTLAKSLDIDASEHFDQIITALRHKPTTQITVLADALDESRDPLSIGASLRRLASLPWIRVLVGTRQSVHEDPDVPIPQDQAILDALDPDRLQLLERDPDAVKVYVTQRLETRLGDARLKKLSHTRIAELATTIAEYDQPFLFARLAVAEIVYDSELVQDEAALKTMLDGGHSGIFGHAVGRLKSNAPKVEALLHALTYSRGNGFPRTGGIWQVAASALSRKELYDTDIDTALHLAAPFIMQDSEFGNTTYRLAHRTFAEWYLRQDSG